MMKKKGQKKTTKKKSPTQGEQEEEWSKENSAEENDSRGTTTSVLGTQKRGWLARNNEPRRERPPEGNRRHCSETSFAVRRSVRWRGNVDLTAAPKGDKKSGERVYFNWSLCGWGGEKAENSQGRSSSSSFFSSFFSSSSSSSSFRLDNLRIHYKCDAWDEWLPLVIIAERRVNASRYKYYGKIRRISFSRFMIAFVKFFKINKYL